MKTLNRYTDPCIYATDGRQEVLVLAHPRCPVHGDGKAWRVVGVPGFLAAREGAR
jgi:hypothetical protein